MKKISCSIFLLAASVFGASAQLYVKAGLGYAMPQAGQTTYDTPIPYNGFPSGYSGTRSNPASGESYTYNIKGASFSSGIQGDLGLGYMFSGNVGVQMDMAFGVANKKYTFNDENVTLHFTGGSTILSDITTVQQCKNAAFLLPSIVVQTGGKVNIYGRFGVALPLNTKVKQDIMITNAPGTGASVTNDFSWQIKSKFSLGYAAAAGVKYKLNKSMSLWCELSMLSISASTKQQDLKSWTRNGQPVSLLSYGYAQHITFSKTATVDTNFASMPTYSQPFSNVGINVGVSFDLSEPRRKAENHANNDVEAEEKKPYRRR